MENKNTHAGTGGGFLLGLLIGIMLTLLVTTKKGREILRDLMDRVISQVSELDHKMEKPQMDEDEMPGDDYIKKTPEEVIKEVKYLAEEPNVESVVKELVKPVEEKHVLAKAAATERVNRKFFIRKSGKKALN